MKKTEFKIKVNTRKIKRYQMKKAKSKIGKLKGTNPLGIRKSRQERKALAKRLKVNFEPRYNGKRFRVIQKLEYGKLIVKEYKEIG